jgi:hypothetical protein
VNRALAHLRLRRQIGEPHHVSKVVLGQRMTSYRMSI